MAAYPDPVDAPASSGVPPTAVGVRTSLVVAADALALADEKKLGFGFLEGGTVVEVCKTRRRKNQTTATAIG